MGLRRLATLAAVVVAAPVAVVSGQVPADAYTTCRVGAPHDGGLVTRSCTIDSSRIGGRIKGVVFWNYKQSSGRGDNGETTLQINDRTGDGHCTILKLKYRGSDSPQTVTRKACGGGKYGPKTFTLNSGFEGGGGWGFHTDGYYSIEHCSGKASTCIELWRQKVGQRPPA